MSIEATEVGLQFLRDATEQYNFESEVAPPGDSELAGVPVGQLISDATLESAHQADFQTPISGALTDDETETLAEPEQLEVDLRANAIVGGSLFDHPVASDEDPEQPTIVTDDPSEVDEDRLQEIRSLLHERVKRRLHVDALPGEAEDERAEGEAASSLHRRPHDTSQSE